MTTTHTYANSDASDTFLSDVAHDTFDNGLPVARSKSHALEIALRKISASKKLQEEIYGKVIG